LAQLRPASDKTSFVSASKKVAPGHSFLHSPSFEGTGMRRNSRSKKAGKSRRVVQFLRHNPVASIVLQKLLGYSLWWLVEHVFKLAAGMMGS
jgi:hypothetical protein